MVELLPRGGALGVTCLERYQEGMVDRLFGIVPKDVPQPDDLTVLIVRCQASF